MMRSKVFIYAVLLFIFLIAGAAATYLSDRPADPQRIANAVSNNLEEELHSADEKAEAILELIREQPNAYLPNDDKFSFFVYDRRQVLRWSDNAFVPTISSVADTFKLKLLRAGSSDYLAKKWRISKEKFLIGIIPLSRKYTITNDYLKFEWNRRVFRSGNISILEPGASIGIAVCAQDECPFRISFLQEELPVYREGKIAAIIFIGVFIVLLVLLMYELFRKLRYPDISFLLLFLCLLGLRLAMTNLNFPGYFISADLFNPQIFASSDLNASLGDLLLNEIALFLLSLFLFKNLFRFRLIRSLQQKKATIWLLSFLAGLFVLMAMLFPFVVIQTIYNNSAIVLDISQSLQFDSLRVTALVIVLLSGVCSFLFSHAFIRLLIGDENLVRIVLCFLLSAGVFIWVNQTTEQEFVSSLIAGTAYLLLVYLMKLYSSLRRLSFATFTYLFVTIFFLSANGAYAIQHFSRQEKIENQFRFANNFLIERDYFGEYLLRELAVKISRDVFIQTRVATPFFGKDAIRQKIRQVFLTSYFNKYDVEIYIFNSDGQPVDNRSRITLPALLATYNKDAVSENYEGVFFVSSPASDVTQKYLIVVPIRKTKAVGGHIVVELSLKKIIPESVYPELLVDNSFQQFYRAQELSYAVFSYGKVLYSSGGINYEQFGNQWLGNPGLYTTGIHDSGYNHIALEDESGRVAVVSSPSPSATHVLANFSFLLVLALVAILIFILIQGLINYVEGHKLYFAARIQLLLNMAFFLPLIMVSVVTLSVTNRSSQNQINDEYLSKAKKFSEQIANQLDAYLNRKNDNVTSFENQMTSLAKLSNLEANVYNGRGILMATTQPLIFENNLISNYINPRGLERVRRGDNLFIETEKVGSLKYFIAYAALKSGSTGNLNGILGIPFFQSVYSLEKVQINIVANILNIFALIFIALVVLSYFVSEWLTFPLTFITQSLKKTSLTKINQPLVWKADDEIGLMVKEYNQMLYKLSESKVELEQTQRETAWREIAQQVAHEIKNPLTPMKLMLQQLERSVQHGNTSPEKTRKAIESLLTQVNTLNDIASSFSSFARMPQPVIKSIEIISLLKRIVDLHSHAENLRLETPSQTLHVFGDEQLLGRTFSNIILNALQAGRPGEVLHVVITLQQIGERCLISFADNGKGIEANVAERIFLPHFTTKKSGSGLGLAIAKQAIEQMNGRIWFETRVGEGTTFYIELLVSEETGDR